MVDRPDVDTPQGAEPTGTNGRRQHNTRPHEGRRHQPCCETHACGNEHEHAQAIRQSEHASTIRSPSRQETPTLQGSAELKIRGGHGLGETPGPIPNPEAKTQHGNGTAPGRVWESSTPPPLNVIKGGISRIISLETPPFSISATDLGLKIHAFSQSHIPSN